MNRVIACLLALFTCAGLGLAGCGGTHPAPPTSSTSTSLAQTTTTEPGSTSTTASSSTTTSASTTTTSASTTTTVPHFSVTTPQGRVTLTPEQLAGQRVIYSYAGLTPPESLLQLIREGKAAGVAFDSDNISSLSQIKAVVAQLEQAAQSPDDPIRAPLLLMADQEGGNIRRLPGQPLLSEKQIGASAEPAHGATEAGTGAGLNLAGVGLNVNLAPVLDVFRTTGDFADHLGRSYSMDPSVVSALGADFIKAQQHAGVDATAKHFPGLGAATLTQNTDLRAVTLDVPLSSLRSMDELPYKAAIGAGVRLVMVSWAVYPALSPRPAGFSSIVVVQELRDRLGFKGVTVTDALNAGALDAYGSFGRRAVLAAGAGMDLILCSGRQPTDGHPGERWAFRRPLGWKPEQRQLPAIRSTGDRPAFPLRRVYALTDGEWSKRGSIHERTARMGRVRTIIAGSYAALVLAIVTLGLVVLKQRREAKRFHLPEIPQGMRRQIADVASWAAGAAGGVNSFATHTATEAKSTAKRATKVLR